MLERLKSKLPTRNEIVPVYAVIVFFLFAWSFYRLFWYIPSWLEYLKPADILVIAAYALGFALLESLLVLVVVLLVNLILPQALFKGHFVVQGSTLIAFIAAGSVALQRKMRLLYTLALWELALYPLLFLVAVIIVILVSAYVYNRFPRLARFVNNIADRMTVFLYIFVPLGLLGLAVVILRNIL